MHNAPAVTYPVGRSLFHGASLVAVGLLGLLALGLWVASSAALGWRQGVMAVALAGTVLVAAAAWQRSPQGHLRWDGHCWAWAPAGAVADMAATQVAVHLDFQSWMLLSVQTHQGQTVWLWPERRSQVLTWDALRRAVFARSVSGDATETVREQQRSQAKA